MSTNYYAESHFCDCCQRSELTHIGSSFRLLRAYTDHDIVGTIRTWAEWRAWLTSSACDGIQDEYGDRHDIAEFIAKWKPLPDAHQRVETSETSWRHQFPASSLEQYVDPEGFILSCREFS